ncbi:hypothetical protein D3C71_1330740 [compost metagenome]
MSACASPSALAWAWSMSRCSSALSPSPFRRTELSPSSWLAAPTTRCCAACSAARPAALLSCSHSSKPLDWPSPRTAGGASTFTFASARPRKCLLARAMIAAAVLSASRSPHGLSARKPCPAFCPVPALLRPTTTNAASRFCCSFCMKYWLICAPSASVRAIGVPSGVENWNITWPWSSTGRKPVGMRAYSATIATITSR